MKGTVVLIIMICICIKTNAQTVTLTGKNLDIEKVFREIRKQTGYNFIYNVAWLHQMKPVTLTLDHVALIDALNKTFVDEPFTYTIIDKTIALKEKPIAQKKNDDLNTPEEINGHVTDSLGNPLAGASVLVKGSKNGTTTDAKGDFSLSGAAENKVIVISFTGYSSKQIPIISKDPIVVSLNKSVSPLDEVQVIAYGTTTRRLSTGDVSTIKAETIEKQPVSNVLQAMEGRIPGLEITQATGLPGSGITVMIRGINSIASGNEPLFIVDGVPYQSLNVPFNTALGIVLGGSNNSNGSGGYFSQGNPLSDINPSDIESVDVLKDADATAIYGSQGANGVILITTKKGKAGATKVDVNLQAGWGHVPRELPLLNTRQYLDMRHEAFANDEATPNPQVDYDLTLWDTTRNTDWQKELIGNTSHYADMEASVSGGNANTQYLVGLGYTKQTTVFLGDFGYQRGSAHFNISNSSPNNKFKIVFSGSYAAEDNLIPHYDLTMLAMQLPPDAPSLYKADGSINWAPTASGTTSWIMNNPAAITVTGSDIKTGTLISSLQLSYQLTTGLQIKSSFGYTNTQTNLVSTFPLKSFDPATWAYRQRQTDFANNNFHSWIIEPQALYIRNIQKAVLTVQGGMTIEQNTTLGQEFTAKGFSSDQLMTDIASATSVTPYSTNAVYKYNGAFGRININQDNRYLLDLTARRDGSSRFGPANQFHNFWAVGTGWIFSQSKFIKEKLPFLSFGKLKLSYGTTGNDQLGDYTFLDLYSSVNYGVPYLGAAGLSPTRIYTPNLQWEETTKLEAGLDLGFCKDRLTFSIAVYRNRSTNQLLGYLIPSVTGFASVERNLDALLQNEGIEFQFHTVNIKNRNFSWVSNFNISANRNELVSGSPGLDDYYTSLIGHPIGSQYAFQFAGVNPYTGIYQFKDSHGGVVTNPNEATDRNLLLNTWPKYHGGLDNTISYKTFQLDIFFQFVCQPFEKQYLYYGFPGTFNMDEGNQPLTALNRWQKPGDVAPIQKFSQNGSLIGPGVNAFTNSDQLYGNASFIRLKNVSLSWQLPETWKKAIHLQNARIYTQGQNLLTFTGYKGLDPESLSSLTLPPLRVITVGIQVTL